MLCFQRSRKETDCVLASYNATGNVMIGGWELAKMKITTYSYVKKRGQIVPFSEINDEERKKAATMMAVSVLNEIYVGKARIFPTDEAPRGAERL